MAPINNMKVLSQQMPAQQQNNQLNQGQQRPGTSQPSQQQLKMLVQQIQMAVQAGYLNHQVFIILIHFSLLRHSCVISSIIIFFFRF